MKSKYLFIATAIFFLLVNTSCLWESQIGSVAVIAFIILVSYFFALLALMIYQVIWLIRNGVTRYKQITVVISMGMVLSLTYFYPAGIFDCRKPEGLVVFVAEREGAANCYTTLKLNAENKFFEESICFGVTETRGDYSIKGDSIFFSNIHLSRGENEYYQFAVITKIESQNKKILGALKRFKNYSDTLPHDLFITKNEFKN